MDKLRPKVAVNVFIIQDNRLLLGKRKNCAGDGDWGLPGGHLEFMERLEDGAKRELEEETGLKAGKLTFLHMINDPRTEDNSHYLHIDFLAENWVGELELKEPDRCYEWKWFDLNNLPKNIFLGHQKSIKAFFEKKFFVD